MLANVDRMLNGDGQARPSLVWVPEHGFGYYPVSAEDYPYDNAYFEKYVAYGNSLLGRRINVARIDLVNKHVGKAPLIDIGIGCGRFVEARGESITFGFDISEPARQWLRDRDLFMHAPGDGMKVATFWDSFEHLPCPAEFVQDRAVVFMSLPIFRDCNHVLTSKHYRKNEHYWYWTANGLVKWFERHGFECIDKSDMETQLGREDIGTFVFRRVAA